MIPPPVGKTPFLYVGTDKAGSTWIADVLRSHPACFVPRAKDLYYFDRFYHRGPEWYRSFFREVGEHHTTYGELSHDYLYSPVAALRIHRDVPGVRILISVREPVERAFSNYLFLVRHGMTRRPFVEALARFPELIEHGLYTEAVRRYRRLFGEDRVKVVVFDDIEARPGQVIEDLYRFLGLDPAHVPDLGGRRSLPAAAPRNAAVALMAKRTALAMRSLGLTSMLGRLKSSPLVQRTLYRRYRSYPELDGNVARELAPFFADDVRELEELLGRDLPGWPRGEAHA